MSNDLQARCDKVYKDYLDIVCKQVQKYESLCSEFPSGVLNEIRAVFTHFAQMREYNHIDKKSEELKALEDAERHMKRAIRDSFKYNCFAYESDYERYHNNFVRSAYSDECLVKIEEEHDKAINFLIIARGIETSVDKDSNVGDVKNKEFYNYEQAITHFSSMYDLIHHKIK